MIKLMIVEDSPTVRDLLKHILSLDPDIDVICAVSTGEEALKVLVRQKPDLITMDIHLPGMDGFEATRRIMETYPLPVVIVSGSVSPDEVATTFRALEAGALAMIARPKGIGDPQFQDSAREFIQTVKLMSEVKVVRRWRRPLDKRANSSFSPVPDGNITPALSEILLVAIGASTGGPLVIQTILAGLPKEFPAPVLIVQHMVSDFIPGFVEWLDQTSEMAVCVASHGETPLPGHAYVAPGGFQMGVNERKKIFLTRNAPENGHRPSVSYLFRSVDKVFGFCAIGVLLTGMGKDGAEELASMKANGSVTIAQDQASSIVFGMPGESIRLGGATYVLPADKISKALVDLAKTMNIKNAFI